MYSPQCLKSPAPQQPSIPQVPRQPRTVQEQLQQFGNVNTTRPKDAAKYALRLPTIFFSEEDLAVSNCTPAEERKILDHKRLHTKKGRCMSMQCYGILQFCVHTYAFAGTHALQRFSARIANCLAAPKVKLTLLGTDRCATHIVALASRERHDRRGRQRLSA